jgi:hypothetical protein
LDRDVITGRSDFHQAQPAAVHEQQDHDGADRLRGDQVAIRNRVPDQLGQNDRGDRSSGRDFPSSVAYS